MTSSKTYKPKHGASLDVLVVGSGIVGLLSAALLLKKNHQVHLTEKANKIGGRLSPELRAGFRLGSGFALDSHIWEKVAEVLGLDTNILPFGGNGSALLHTTRGWVAPEELPSWESYFAKDVKGFPQGGYAGVTEQLLNFCMGFEKFSYSLECPVTALHGEGGKIVRASLGAEVEVNVNRVVWSADYKTLLEVLTGPGIPAPGPERVSWLKRFVKTTSQPGVVLEFAHKAPLGEFTETLLLPFSSGDKEERRYLAGAIVSNRDAGLAPEGKALSSWILPLTEAEWGDNHETMKKIRSGKRLLEKTFANFEQSLEFERVLVLENTVHPLGKRKGEWQKPVANLDLASDWAMPNGATAESAMDTLLQHLE